MAKKVVADATRPQCAIYARVSTEKQAEHNISIPDQIARARLYADTKGWEVVAEYVDPGASGRDESKRPKFREMISEALSAHHPFDVILVHSFSRFYRDQARSELTRRDLKKKRVQVRSLTQEIDDDEGGGTFALSIMALMDEYQSRENSKHVRRAMEANARDGFQNGGTTPYGYRLEVAETRGQRAKRKLAVEPNEAGIVAEIFEQHLNGSGCMQIARYLNEKGLRTRKGVRWHTSAIYALVTNETYVGRNYFKGRDPVTGDIKPREEWVEIPCPPIVSEEVFNQVQDQLVERAPNKTPPRITTSPVLLGGIACCAACGRNLQLSTGTSRTGVIHRYYKCSGRILSGSCTGGRAASIAEADLNSIVLDTLTQQLMVPERVQEIVGAVFEKREEERNASRDRLKDLKALFTKAKREEQNLWTVAASTGLEGLSGFKDKVSELTREREALGRQIAAQEALLANSIQPLDAAQAADAALTMRELATNADIDIQRRYVRAFVARVVVGEEAVRIIGSNMTIAKAASGLPLSNDAQVRGSTAVWLPE